MKKKIILFIFLLCFSFSNAHAKEAVNIYAQPRELPKVTIYHESGKRFKLTDFKGKFVLLVFWSKKCSICIRELESLNNFSKIVKDNGIEVVLLSPAKEWNNFSQTRKFINRFGGDDLQSYWDDNDDAESAFGVFATPHTVLISREGKEIGRIRGGAKWDKQNVIDYIYELKSKHG